MNSIFCSTFSPDGFIVQKGIFFSNGKSEYYLVVFKESILLFKEIFICDKKIFAFCIERSLFSLL